VPLASPGASRTLVSHKPLGECRPDLPLAQHNFVYRVAPGALKVLVWRFVGGNGESVHDAGSGGHASGISSTVWGVVTCDDVAAKQRASVVIGNFGSKKAAEERLQAFVAGVEKVMARVPLTDPEPVLVQSDGGVPHGGCGNVALNFRLKVPFVPSVCDETRTHIALGSRDRVFPEDALTWVGGRSRLALAYILIAATGGLWRERHSTNVDISRATGSIDLAPMGLRLSPVNLSTHSHRLGHCTCSRSRARFLEGSRCAARCCMRT